MSIHKYNRVSNLILNWMINPENNLTIEQRELINHFMKEVRKNYVLKKKNK